MTLIGTMVTYGRHQWFVIDAHGYPTRTVDLRRTIVVDPRRRYLDEAESRRNVDVRHVRAVS